MLHPLPATDRATVEWRASPAPVTYENAVLEMEGRVAAIRGGRARELVWCLEHPPLYTAGTSADAAELLDVKGLPVYKTGRGGRPTWHGPGQRVAYVMLDLKPGGGDIRGFVRDLEAWVIATLAQLGITGERRDGRVGIWVGHDGKEEKIAAIGVRVRRWVSYHGIAVNVAPDLSYYDGIVPCGISEYGVTSLDALGIKASMADVDAALRRSFEDVFAIKTTVVPTPAQLNHLTG